MGMLERIYCVKLVNPSVSLFPGRDQITEFSEHSFTKAAPNARLRETLASLKSPDVVVVLSVLALTAGDCHLCLEKMGMTGFQNI